MNKRPNITPSSKKSSSRSKKVDYRLHQFEAGDHPLRRGHKVFCTNTKGLWWSGFHIADLTPRQLLSLCRSTERDLLCHFPELIRGPISDKLAEHWWKMLPQDERNKMNSRINMIS